jgi:hypothetical protein
MLALPLVFGLVLAGGRGPAPWLVPPMLVLAFLAEDAGVPALSRLHQARPSPAGYLRRRLRWTALYLAGAAAAFAGALLLLPPHARPRLLAVAAAAATPAAIHAGASVRGAGRTLWAELVGLTGLALAAPLAAAAGDLPVVGLPLGAAALALAYSVSSLAYVRAFEALEQRPRAAVVTCFGVHAALVTALVALVQVGWLPPRGLLAFLPVLLRTALGLALPPRDLRQLGRREIGVAAPFAALAAWSLSG